MGQTGRLIPGIDDRTGSFESQHHTLSPQWVRWAAFLLVALLGLIIRIPKLGERPMHTDEAVNAYIVGQLLAGKPFIYDPQDRHGPALAAFAWPLAKILGAKSFADLRESELRLVTVAAGTVTILLFGVAVEMFGFIPCLIAALLFAAAPLPVYYDRYFIHESLFVAVTFALILAAWRAWQTHSATYSALAGACAALMLASKETAVLHFLALAVAGLVYWRWNLRGIHPVGARQPKQALVAIIVFSILSMLLFTWFGSNWKAPGALLHAVPNFLARAHGQGHQEPFWYYIKLVTGGWSGGIIVAFSCIALFLTLRDRTPSPYVFLAYYFLVLAALYSLIPYKTPWLALNFWLPITLFAAKAFESLARASAPSPATRHALQAACAFIGIISALLIAHDTRLRVFVHPADEDNPYAYAHTSEDVLGLPTEIDRLAHLNAIPSPRVAVIASDPWPLPWYLRHVDEVGFWQPGQQPGHADFYITSTEAADQYAPLLKDLRPEFFGVRPGVLIILWSPAPK